MSEPDRIMDLESKVTFQEQTLDDLNRALLSMTRQLAGLAKRLERLEQRVAGAGDGPATDPLEEQPPHY